MKFQVLCTEPEGRQFHTIKADAYYFDSDEVVFYEQAKKFHKKDVIVSFNWRHVVSITPIDDE